MRELLIATRNEGKMPEIRHALQGVPFRIIDVNDVPTLKDVHPDETGSTYEENATIKAKEYGTKSGLLALADDSGVEVDALDGRPGVHSAYYAPGTDKDRCDKLLRELRDVPDERRAARFVTVIALFDPGNGNLRTCRSVNTGRIMREPKGERPFGYDPIFFYDDAGKTGGEMSVEEKHRYSHRGKALKKARAILLAEFT